ncbi:hypothetical protein SAMN04488524_3177 [Pedobacter africanus]|uniref:Uncharacterized protein n=1 Tax=Pedobacter africanus TaxID=151894 RepID=A0A1W2CRD3_9SPHI|nr:hypothetical protein SAMN04488524_3177 [Pedobacter africanus]
MFKNPFSFNGLVLLFYSGEEGANKYGPDPKKRLSPKELV